MRAKRIPDIVGALAALLLFAPLMAIVAVVVRLALGRPVIFRHTRAGYQGRPFVMKKFRTMTDERDASGVLLPDERRLTRVGCFLRSSSLDELPEFWNVLVGDMSLVGPRPLPLEYVGRYNSVQKRRLHAPPGITGWAQVQGRNSLSWERKFELDLWYVNNQTLWLDLRIIVRTWFLALKREGICQPGHATMPEFKGSFKSATTHE